MDDDMPTSPPGSWPDPNIAGGSSTDEAELPQVPEGQTRDDSGKAEVSQSSKNPLNKAAMLPPEILEQILYLTDPASFASLVLVSSCWRKASQTPHLYAHHLSRCPSFSINNNVVVGPFTDNSLPRLKRLFNQEIKRNLFETYLRPKRTAVNLVSATTSSSASFPCGEAFDFAFSSNGHWTLALSSSRIYVIDTLSPKISVQRELKVRRRPLSATILDDGSILAVLSSHHQVNVYDLSNLELKHLRAVSLDNRPHTLALSPKGEVLAAAYDGGVEVHSIGATALSTERRSVKCDLIDSLGFSSDGTMLLGTTQNSKNPNTVILTAPYFTEGSSELPDNEVLGHMWTSQIIFPNSSRDCSHAALLPHPTDGDSNWAFAYDRVFESFRAVRTDDMRNGTTYFTGPRPHKPAGARRSKNNFVPCTLPAATDRGELVASGFVGKDIWLYGVPESLDISTVPQVDNVASPGIVLSRSNSSAGSSSNPRHPATSLTSGESEELSNLPQWQVLVDKYRNVFAKGRRVAEVPGVTSVRWVSRRHERLGEKSLSERLIVAAPGGVSGPSELEQDEFSPVDGGRLVILDFDRTSCDGTLEQLNFELGNVKPEILDEGDVDMDTEVDIVRQRTVRKQRESPRGSNIADILAAAPELPTQHVRGPAVPQTAPSSAAPTSEGPDQTSDDTNSPPDGLTLEEASAAFDGPYSHTAPRSRTSLYRSSTAVAATRQRNPSRILDSGRVVYRRADGRGELPHESDADNWVPPPPPYTKEADAPLPEHLRLSLMPRRTEPIRRANTAFERPRRATTLNSPPLPFLPTEAPTRRFVSSPGIQQNTTFRQRPLSTVSSRRDSSSERRPSNPELEVSRPASPVSSMGISHHRAPSESSGTSRRGSASSTTRRPVSAFVGRPSSSLEPLNIARLSSPISPIADPPVPTNRPGESISLPNSPNVSGFRNLTLSGANLQHRLEYPLPPRPEGNQSPIRPSTSHAGNMSQTMTDSERHLEMIAATMPSAQQLANLNRRVHSPPPMPGIRPPSSGTVPQPSHTRPSPPRGALGAAGNPSARPPSRRRSIHQRDSFAASSPALLRPSARRLDTIHSVSSFLSHSRTRSRSREPASAGEEAMAPQNNRSNTRTPSRPGDAGVARRKSFFGGRRHAKKIQSGDLEYRDDAWQRVQEERREPKGGKCVLM
ncbi:MAG: hypothetical protein Q9191_007817 [Dirinaria sp. TL-2023a]